MQMLRLAAALALSTIAAGQCAVAQTPAAPSKFPKFVTGTIDLGCRQGECNVLRLVRRTLLRTSGEDEIYALSIARSQFSDGDRAARQRAQRGGTPATSHVVCSLRTPAYIFQIEDDPEYIRHALAPGDDRGKAGYNLASYKIYYAACHGVLHDDMPSKQAQGLGYPAQGRSGQSEHKRLEDALKGG